MPPRSFCTSYSRPRFAVLIVDAQSVMGLFPIIMNVLQFWLIDSIVKAHAPPLALDDDSSRLDACDGDREPLFQADGSDGEDEMVDDSEFTPPKYDAETPEPLTAVTPTIISQPRPLTPDLRSFPSGSSTPFPIETGSDDVAMKRVHSPPLPPVQRPAATELTNPNGDEWTWDEAGEEWDRKRSLDALRSHHD